MNEESWLHALRSDPSPQFSARLRERLRAQEPAAAAGGGWPRRALLAAASVVVAAGLLSVPAVRGSVARFVSLFRVVHFVAVPVESSRLDRLSAEQLDLRALIGENVEVLQDPGPPAAVASLEDAAAAAGMTPAVPQWLPPDSTVLETMVVGERVLRVNADGRRQQQVMDALGIDDVPVPAGLDGSVVNVRVPPVVMIRWEHGKRRTRLFQARTPELTLPDTVDVRALGEIGLRILGMGPDDAKQFAQAIDWHTTLVVPVPPNASSFRQIDVGGRRGVLIEHQPKDQSPTSTIVWSTADRVFALVSIQGQQDALAMANSVR